MRSGEAGIRSLKALDLAVRRRVGGAASGDHAGLGIGVGSEAEEIVRYQSGQDDVRWIDWNVTARAQDLHVWRPRSEHELETWVLVDGTASMDFGTADVEKRDLAAWVTGAIGVLTDGPGNRTGIAHLTADGLRWRPAGPGPLAGRKAMRMLESAPRGAGNGPDLASAITTLDRRHRRPGLRVIVSDFVPADGETRRPYTWERPLRRLAARHDVLVVEVVDPRELELPDVGFVVLVDPESGRRLEVDTTRPALRATYAHEAQLHRSHVATAIRAAGAGHLRLRTDRDWVTDLTEHVRARRRTPARRGGRR